MIATTMESSLTIVHVQDCPDEYIITYIFLFVVECVKMFSEQQGAEVECKAGFLHY